MTDKFALLPSNPISLAEFIQKAVAAIQVAGTELSTTKPAAVALTAAARTTRAPSTRHQASVTNHVRFSATVKSHPSAEMGARTGRNVPP